MRADAGFFAWKLVDTLTRLGVSWSVTVRINPSILSADFVNLEREVARIGSADAVHVDHYLLGPELRDALNPRLR